MSFFNGTVIDQIYIVYGLIALVLVLILILVILDRREKKKRSKSFIEPVSKKEKEEVTLPVTAKVEIPIIEPVEPTSPDVPLKEDNTPNEVEEEMLDTMEDDPDLEKTQAQIEIQQITKALEKAEEEDDKIKLTHFEQEQEANAIISINELMKKSNDLYQKNETVQYMDEGNEPINLEELKSKYEQEQESTPIEETPSVSVTKEKLPDFATEKELATAKENNRKPSKFKSSPIISPVYGIEKGTESTPHKEPPIELENTADLDQLDDEIRKTNEFLRILKELKKNLQ